MNSSIEPSLTAERQLYYYLCIMKKQLTANELRQKFIDFFVSKDHKQISGASLIPENDPTVLFTTAGMHPLVPYILGSEHPSGRRLVNYQKCIRTGDIEAVGDPHHLTFFEMLGNWSLGDYFKEEAIAYSHEFLTTVLGLETDELSVTVFAGDDEVPRDEEAAAAWRKHGVPDERIYFLPREDNWWGPAGETGPCGPDSEMFIDTGREACGKDCRPGCSCGKYFEIWNDVFMQYVKNADGTYTEMERKCIDTGMGIERTIAILQGNDRYMRPVFTPIIKRIETLANKTYGENEEDDMSIGFSPTMSEPALHPRRPERCFPLQRRSGIHPSPPDSPRRSGTHKLGIEGSFLSELAEVVIELYKKPYPELLENREFVMKELVAEEAKFSATLAKGGGSSKDASNLLKSPNGSSAVGLRSSSAIPTAIRSS